MRPLLFIIVVLLASAGSSLAQEATPTPLILGPINLVTPTPTLPPTPVPEDPRPAVCSAPFQPGFVPVIVRPGDRLVDLLSGPQILTITQIAALNCLDDAAALPIGAVLWLPALVTLQEAVIRDPDPAVDQASIASFSASADRIASDQTLILEWEAAGSAAYLYRCPPALDSACLRPVDARPVPLRYSTPPIGPFPYAGPVRYRLEVVDGTARSTRDVTIEVRCAAQNLVRFNGGEPCLDQPLRSLVGVWQPFERGDLIWFQETRQIWALLAGGRLLVTPDTYREGDPESAEEPPSGFQRPVRGFGKVWSELGGAAGVLGWATNSESGTDLLLQGAGRVAYTTYLQIRGVRTYAVTLLPGAAEGIAVIVPDPQEEK